MNTHVVILAQGVQSRLPNLTVAKQMLPLPACAGTPILYRTLRQVWEIANERVTVVAWYPLVVELMRGSFDKHPRVAFERCPVPLGVPPYFPGVVTLPDPGNSSLKGIARYLEQASNRRYDAAMAHDAANGPPPTKPDRTVVLLGDVVYSWACLRAILSQDPKVRVRFVGTSNISPSAGELWGVSWTADAEDLMISSLAHALKKHPPFEDTYQCGQLRRWMWAVHPELQKTERYVAVDDYTRDIDLPEHVEMLWKLSRDAALDDILNGVSW